MRRRLRAAPGCGRSRAAAARGPRASRPARAMPTGATGSLAPRSPAGGPAKTEREAQGRAQEPSEPNGHRIAASGDRFSVGDLSYAAGYFRRERGSTRVLQQREPGRIFHPPGSVRSRDWGLYFLRKSCRLWEAFDECLFPLCLWILSALRPTRSHQVFRGSIAVIHMARCAKRTGHRRIALQTSSRTSCRSFCGVLGQGAAALLELRPADTSLHRQRQTIPVKCSDFRSVPSCLGGSRPRGLQDGLELPGGNIFLDLLYLEYPEMCAPETQLSIPFGQPPRQDYHPCGND